MSDQHTSDTQEGFRLVTTVKKISPVRDWRSTPRVAFKHSWSWPWIGSYGMPSYISHGALSIYQISLKSEKLFCGRTIRRDTSKFKVTWHKT